MFGLPFKQVWALDFEFVAPAGALPAPVCLVAQELGSRRLIRLWRDQLGAEPPFPVDDDTLFVAYYASAELGCFLQLGWPLPPRLLDLYTEFRNATNGIPLPEGRGLLGALSYHGIPAITAEQKHAERELVMRGGPWTAAERRRILDYCQTDVDPLGALLERMLPEIMARPNGFGRALLRGRYMAAVARMERSGVPIDIDMLRQPTPALGQHQTRTWSTRWTRTTTCSTAPLSRPGCSPAICADNGIDWPRTATGRLQLDQDTFRDMALRYPQLGTVERPAPLAERASAREVGRGSTTGEIGCCSARSARRPGATRPATVGSSSGRQRVAARADQAGRGPRPGLHRLEVARGLRRRDVVGRPRAAGRRAVRRSISGVRQDGRPGAGGCHQAVPQGDSGPVQDLRARDELRDAGAQLGGCEPGCR